MYSGVITASPADDAVCEALLPTIHPADSHAANLAELSNGDILCTWFNGPGEGEPGTDILLSRLPAGARRWERPVRMSADPHRSEQNPVLFVAPDETVWLLHTSNEPHDQKSAHVVVRRSTDGGRNWSAAEVLFSEPGTFLRSPVVVMSNGDWLLPVYYCGRDGEHSAVKISSDAGRTWRDHPVPDSLGRVQMSVVELRGGTLLALFRGRGADRIYVSRSTDLGRTWSVPERTELPNNNSSVQLTALGDGRLALIFNDATLDRDQFRWVRAGEHWRRKAVRTPLTVALSADGGKTWPHQRNVQMADDEYRDNELGYSYPSILQARDGRLHLAFSYLRKTIKYVTVSPEWVMGR